MAAVRKMKKHNKCANCAAWSKDGSCKLGFDNGYDPMEEKDKSLFAPIEACPKPKSLREVQYFVENGHILSDPRDMRKEMA